MSAILFDEKICNDRDLIVEIIVWEKGSGCGDLRLGLPWKRGADNEGVNKYWF